MNSKELRKKFFDYFSKLGHEIVPSSSLIPAKDPTLLFTNAGMNQFKGVFLSKEKRSYSKAVSIQKCIRAGGKHNDLDNVGFTRRHLTFFEMMGNFSFGDYFKKEAIEYAWQFLTNEIKLPIDKLLVSVYEQDNESYQIWNKNIGLPKERIFKLGEADNFWSMADTGPCGPCTEIYIDRGSKFGCSKLECGPLCSCDRFLEIWNLVFMQYDRQSDGTLNSLKTKGVDTGMGLERLCSVLQNTDSVYETDLFIPIIKQIEKLTNISYETADGQVKSTFRVLSDHIRSSCFAIADGCTPSNEGRGYVLRKIIRRAALFAQKLNKKNIFPDLASVLINSMSDIYPELKTNEKIIIALLKNEIEKFSANLINGQKILKSYFAENKNKTITGEQAFKLYDTYGFPLELTVIISKENGFEVDIKEFEKYMEQQRMQSGKKVETQNECPFDENIYTHFTGYEEHITKSRIKAIIVDNKKVKTAKAGTSCYIITEHSPFYVECGGQVSDQGYIRFKDKETPLLGLKKIGKAIAAYIDAPVDINLEDEVTLIVDTQTRINTMKNHTATHLLQAALISIFGKHVKQSGSIVEPDYLRFDFTYHENLTPEQITLIENIVNKKIMENIPVKIEYTTLKEATERGVIAFFGEKYNPEEVRIVQIPGFSSELCGGTHVKATGDIGLFKIIEVSALSAGNRRIVALTGPKAIELYQKTFNIVKSLSQEFKVPSENVLQSVIKQKEQLKSTQIKIKELKRQLYKVKLPTWLNDIEVIKSLPFLYLMIEDAEPQDLQNIAQDLLKEKKAFYFLVTRQEAGRSMFLATIAPDIANLINIKEFTAWLGQLGIQGGGKENTIQGGAPSGKLLISNEIKSWLEKNIK